MLKHFPFVFHFQLANSLNFLCQQTTYFDALQEEWDALLFGSRRKILLFIKGHVKTIQDRTAWPVKIAWPAWQVWPVSPARPARPAIPEEIDKPARSPDYFTSEANTFSVSETVSSNRDSACSWVFAFPISEAVSSIGELRHPLT